MAFGFSCPDVCAVLVEPVVVANNETVEEPMTDRPEKPGYVWRLTVTAYPVEPNDAMREWWHDYHSALRHGDDGLWSFPWPATRRYLTQRAATERADLLRSYGCTVDVQRSEPVSWPEDRPGEASRALIEFPAFG